MSRNETPGLCFFRGFVVELTRTLEGTQESR
jgi:hypothetical protein